MTVAARELATRYIDQLDRDIHYRPGTVDEQVIEDVFTHGYHRPPIDTPPGTVLDCGAHIGLTMLDYRTLWPDARIVGVEMDAANAAIAQLNTQDPVLCAAVAAHTGIGHYSPDTDTWGYQLAGDGPRYVVKVALGALIADLNLNRVDFLKLDVEGEERSIFRRPSLARVRSLLVELHGGYTKTEAIGDLLACGFRAVPHDAHPEAVYAWRD